MPLAGLVAVAIGMVALPGPAAAAKPDGRLTGGDARVGGIFTMHGVVTVAVDVRGERRGERVRRRWTVVALGCDGGSVCNRLLVTRNRGPVADSFTVLHRIGAGRYSGHGAFWAPLECLGRTHALGSHVPYTLTLAVARRRRIGSIWYATAVRATYANAKRSNSTRCPLGPAHDAARYRGRLTSRLPKPPPYAIKRKRHTIKRERHEDLLTT